MKKDFIYYLGVIVSTIILLFGVISLLFICSDRTNPEEVNFWVELLKGFRSLIFILTGFNGIKLLNQLYK